MKGKDGRAMELRFASAGDAAELLDIYRQYIDTTITFEYDLPTLAEFTRRIETISAEYPYLVCQADGALLGYAYAHRAFQRAAYQWCAELSVYLRPEARGRGLGPCLYRTLMDMLRLQGVRMAYGVVTSPNPRSEALHRALGFTQAGFFHNSGYKAGAWRDVIWFEKPLLPFDTPQPFCGIDAIPRVKLDALLKQYL